MCIRDSAYTVRGTLPAGSDISALAMTVEKNNADATVSGSCVTSEGGDDYTLNLSGTDKMITVLSLIHILRDRTSRDEASDTQPIQYGFSQEAETSLGWLRDRIDFPMTMFGAAYLGYVGGLFEEGFEAGFPAWLWETNEAMLLEYPFITEIDEDHIIGGAGYLYCIVPVDENATVAINRVQWNEKTQTDEVTEVLYRSESGEPDVYKRQ